MNNLGIPYMGSKRKLATDILLFMIRKNPTATKIYDIFGGGGAISFTALQMPQFEAVTYNELDRRIFSLVEYIKNAQKHKKDHLELYKLGQVYEDKLYEWVSRDRFKKEVAEEGWYAGFLQSVWTFGNRGTSYLFGKEIEEYKRLGHMVAVYRDEESFGKLKVILPSLPKLILSKNTIYQRRLIIFQCATERKYKELQQLQQLEQLQRLEITNLSYADIDPKSFDEKSIVYLDPPYINTASYKEDGISHDDLYKWIAGIEVPVYLSSYESPLKPVKAMNHRTTLSAVPREKEKSERTEWLFWNGKSII